MIELKYYCSQLRGFRHIKSKTHLFIKALQSVQEILLNSLVWRRRSHDYEEGLFVMETLLYTLMSTCKAMSRQMRRMLSQMKEKKQDEDAPTIEVDESEQEKRYNITST